MKSYLFWDYPIRLSGKNSTRFKTSLRWWCFLRFILDQKNATTKEILVEQIKALIQTNTGIINPGEREKIKVQELLFLQHPNTKHTLCLAIVEAAALRDFISCNAISTALLPPIKFGCEVLM